MEFFVPCVSSVVSLLLFAILCSPIGAKFIAKLKKREDDQNAEAIARQTVVMDKIIVLFFRIGAFLLLGFCIVAAIPFYKLTGYSYGKADFYVYVAINVVVWVFSIIMWILIYLETKKVNYDENGFTVVNCFGFEKRYSYGDIVKISGKRNKRIKLKKGSLLLFNAMAGLQGFLFRINRSTGAAIYENIL